MHLKPCIKCKQSRCVQTADGLIQCLDCDHKSTLEEWQAPRRPGRPRLNKARLVVNVSHDVREYVHSRGPDKTWLDELIRSTDGFKAHNATNTN